jgi:hypothetical protein
MCLLLFNNNKNVSVTRKYTTNHHRRPLGQAYFISWITESPHLKNPKVFFPPLICVTNKKLFSVDHIGRAYKSAIPRGRLKYSAVLLLET